MVERANILPPQGQIGPITEGERDQLMRSSLIFGVYEKLIDRESAPEILSQKQELLEEERRQAEEEKERIRRQKEEQKAALEAERARRAAERQRKADQGILGEMLDQVGKSAKRQITTQLDAPHPEPAGCPFRKKINTTNQCSQFYSNIIG